MRDFFANVKSAISDFFTSLGAIIHDWFSRLFQTKPMQKVGTVLGYIPNKISDRLKNKTRKSIWGIIFIIPLAIGFIYFFAIPLVLTVIYSFSYVEKFQNVAGLKTIFVGWNNYIYIFKDFTISISYVDYIFTELLVKAFTSIITDLPVILIFSLVMAVVLNSKFAGRTLVRAIFFMPVIFNSQAIDMAIASRSSMTAIIYQNTQTIFDQMFSFKDFLLNANLPVFLVTFLSNASAEIYNIISYSGIQILIFLTAIQSVPVQLYEAAKMEGCTTYEMFWKITFPMVSPMLLTNAVYTIVDSYTRSPMVKALTNYTNSKKSDTKLAPGLTGKAFEIYKSYAPADEPADGWGESLAKLSNYGIGAALSLLYSIMVLLIIAIVLLILRGAVFYYDK